MTGFDSNILPLLFPEIEETRHFTSMRKQGKEILPILHHFPYNTVRHVRMFRNMKQSARHSAANNDGFLYFLPNLSTKGRLSSARIQTVRKWLPDSQQSHRAILHQSQRLRSSKSYHVRTVTEFVTEHEADPQVCTLKDRVVRELCPFNRETRNVISMSNSFLYENQLISIKQIKSHGSFISSFHIQFTNLDGSHLHHKDSNVAPLFLVYGSRWHTVFCSITRRIWLLDLYESGPSTKVLRVIHSNDIFSDHITWTECKVDAYQYRESCDPLKNRNSYHSAHCLMEGGILYFYSGDAHLYYFDTLSPFTDMETHSSKPADRFVWRKFEFLTCPPLLENELLHDIHLSMDDGKIVITANQKYFLEDGTLAKRDCNHNVYLIDLKKRTFECLPLLLPPFLSVCDVALLRNSIYLKIHGDEFSHLMEWKIRDHPVPLYAGCRAGSALLCDMDIICQDEGCESSESISDSYVAEANDTMHDLNDEDSLNAFKVEWNAIGFMREYAKKHGHSMPQFVGDAYWHLEHNMDQFSSDEWFTWSKSANIRPRSVSDKRSNKGTAKKMNKRSRKQKLSDADYLREVAEGLLYDLESPLLGEAMETIFHDS